jgi:hypothetical protein
MHVCLQAGTERYLDVKHPVSSVSSAAAADGFNFRAPIGGEVETVHIARV